MSLDFSQQQIWNKTLELIKREISELSYDTWIRRIEALYIQDYTIYLRAQDNTHLERANTYTDLIENSLFLVTHQKYQVQFVLKGDQISFLKKARENEQRQNQVSRLNQNYRFDTFVVGPANEFAQAACVAVAENNSRLPSFNPLFLYGGSGLGKTHLINAIGNYIVDHYPEKQVIYLQTEEFVNEFIQTIQRNAYDEFRSKYRQVDMLLIDDIQFIEGKEQMQMEFFHTFNALYENHKSIIMTCDKPPHSLKSLEERLRTRFASGLIVDVQRPDYETRLAILKNKALRRQIDVDEEVLSYIAKSVDTNVRELEGAYNTFLSYTILTKNKSLETAKLALRGLVNEEKMRRVDHHLIFDLVSSYYQIRSEDLLSSKRKKEFAFPRQVAMYLCREDLDMTYAQIGEAMGKDHSTVMHAVNKISDQVKDDVKLELDLTEIRKRF
ncbi:MAG: chromosomal replication initiator protein DnaA [Eubacteriales bacterium]|nr:chromosomal replication initiator protein DnaA [Eubacteriales bacterium]